MAQKAQADPVTFRTADAWRRWLQRYHATATEIIVRCFRTSTADRGITYAQALDEALCFGWIDGVRRSLDDASFSTRFSPRRPRSIWSRVNVAHVQRLTKEGRMTAPGLAAFAARQDDRTGVYSFEQRPSELPPAYARRFRKQREAWAFFAQQPPYYRRVCTHWIMSAKRDETRERRLATLIDCSARKQRIPALAKPTSRRT